MPRWPIAVALPALLCLAACGPKDESLAKKTGAKVGETVSDFGAGVGDGIDAALKPASAVETSPAAAELGFSTTVSKWDGNALSVYVIAKDKASATLLARAFNKAGEEIGRCKVDAAFEKDDAKYVKFEFARETDPKRVTKCVVDVAK